MVDANDYAFINGGPGSWKSTLAIEMVTSILRTKGKVAWLAPSNALVDDAVKRMKRRTPEAVVYRALP
jgi:hypothetical protein